MRLLLCLLIIPLLAELRPMSRAKRLRAMKKRMLERQRQMHQKYRPPKPQPPWKNIVTTKEEYDKSNL